MFLMVGVANASEFTDANKKVGEYVYTLGSYSYRAPAGVLTVDQAKAARAAFGVDILYFESEAGFLCYVDKDDNIGAASSPVSGTAIITSVLSDEKYVQLYDSIVVAEEILPNLALDKHQGWGSKYNVDAVSDAIKNAIGDITNNAPYTQLAAAINEAKESFKIKNSSTETYGIALTTIYNNIKGYQEMFDNLEALRDSMALYKAFCEGKTALLEGGSTKDLNRALLSYPVAETIFEGSWKQALDDYKRATAYALIGTDIQSLYVSIRQLSDNSQRYSDDDLKFYDEMNDPNYVAPEAESKYGYPAIPNISYAEYALFVKVPATQMIDAGVYYAKEVAAWAGSAPFISYSGIAMSTANFAINMTFAGMLMAENIKHMQTLKQCIDWLNKECQDDRAYAFLSEEVARSRMNLRSCDNSAIAELQHGILKDALVRGKELSNLGVKKLELQNLIFQAQDLYYEMPTKRANTLGGNFEKFQAKANLRKCLSAAEIEKDKNYVIKTVTYQYMEQYSLYNFEYGLLLDPNYKFAENETPSQIVTREIKKLQNAMDLYQKQYEFEQLLDEVIAYKDELYASPAETVNQKWQASEEFNNLISQNKKLIADIDDEISKIKAALALAADHQKTIQDQIDATEQAIEDMVNNGPTDSLLVALKEALSEFKTEKDWAAVLDAIGDLVTEREYDVHTYDAPDYYLDTMIERAQAFFDENKAQMTPAQISAYDRAMAAALVAAAEWDDARYQSLPQLEREWKLFRMYCASLALEYVEKLTIDANPDAATAEAQLEEAMVLVAIAAASGYDGDIEEFRAALAEGNAIYRDQESTDTEKEAAARKLRALLGQATGISTVNSGNASLRDGKYFQNGKLIIVKAGKKFNAVGIAQ